MGWLVYIIAGLLWGLFAANMQLNRSNNVPGKVQLTFAINAIGWPIGMSIAIYKLR